MNDKNEKRLREELIKVLQQPKADYGQVLDLSAKLAELDQDNVRFSVDASHISRLGRELVVHKETAVAELVKNAYDADSTTVTLIFENTASSGGRLIIVDDGHGMTREQIISGFMRLSTTDKIENPYSPRYNRLRAGRKGIGRFATQRLGRKLTIITQAEHAKNAFEVRLDWNKFEANQELFHISSHIESIARQSNSGTRLIIEDVEDKWTEAEIKRVYRHLSGILQPFPLSKKMETDKRDPGFVVKILKSYDGKIDEIASAETLIYQYALAEIDAEVDDKGNGKWSITSKRLDINEKNILIGVATNDGKMKAYEDARNIHLKAYYYIYEKNLIPNPLLSMIRELNNEEGGIRVYRNGFRVLPYGGPDDDWLQLDERDARRKILVPIKNQNFIGIVEIVDPDGNMFEEASSREGLLQNRAFRELASFAGDVLESAVLRVGEARGKKLKPTKTQVTPEARLERATKDIIQAVEDLSQLESNESKETQEIFKQKAQELSQVLVPNLESALVAQTENVTELLEEISMLRILASLGLAIGEFTHEIRQMFISLEVDANNILKAKNIDKVHLIAKRLNTNIITFKTYTAFFDRTIAANAHRETEPQELNEVLLNFWRITQTSAKYRGINMPKPTVTHYDLFTTPMHQSEWASILFNLFTNAYKAIRRANEEDGKIQMTAGKKENIVYVEFSDNGDGIPYGKDERIFDAFFTTSPLPDPMADPVEGLQGSGLGLKIIKDIVESYNGEIYLAGPPKGYVTCFKIELPAATKEELKEYDY